MNVVAGRTAFPKRFVLEDARLGLLPVTLRALRINARHERALRRINVRAMWIVAGGATHPAFQDRMVELQMEFSFLIEMTLEAGFRFFLRVNDEFAATAAGIHVQAAGTVAGFAATGRADAFAFTGNFQPRMLGTLEILDDGFMAGGTLIHPHKLRAGNERRWSDNTLNGGTRDRQRRNCHGSNAQNC